MAKRSVSSRYSSKLANSYDEVQDEAFEHGKVLSLDAPTIETTKLILKKNVKLKIIGSETANEYLFSGAGSVVDVDNRDVPKMLEKGLGRESCCGSFSTSYFEVVR